MLKQFQKQKNHVKNEKNMTSIDSSDNDNSLYLKEQDKSKNSPQNKLSFEKIKLSHKKSAKTPQNISKIRNGAKSISFFPKNIRISINENTFKKMENQNIELGINIIKKNIPESSIINKKYDIIEKTIEKENDVIKVNNNKILMSQKIDNNTINILDNDINNNELVMDNNKALEDIKTDENNIKLKIE